jgi:neutral ceramidase
MPRGQLHAGFAQADITPDPGRRVELSGYVDREQPATGVRDPLAASVLALVGPGQEPALLVGLDLCILDGQAVARLAAACPVPPARVILCCSHTHAAPATYPLLGCGDPDPAYVEEVARRVGDAARRAIAGAVPVRLGWGRKAVRTLLWGNRRDPAGPVDARLHLLKVERADDSRRPVCAVWSLACHPVVLGPDNRLVSADWVGEVRRALPLPSLFLQGFCGDQNPLRRGEAALADWAVLATELQELWESTPTAPDGPLRLARLGLELPRLPGDGTEGLPEAGRAGRAMRRWAESVARPGRPVPPTPAEVAAVRIGEGAAVFWPGEPHVAHALVLPPDCLGVGHSGASVGYVPERAAYPRGGYEVDLAHRYYGFPSALAPEAGEALREASVKLLLELA